jgi:hypothetical protein
LGELGASDPSISTAVELISDDDPLAMGTDRLSGALKSVGASTPTAEAIVGELETIEAPSPVPRGANLDWGPDPDETLRELGEWSASVQRESRRKQLWYRLQEVLGLPVPVGEPTIEIARIPILMLAAPEVKKAKVTWTSMETEMGERAMTLTVLGTGLGATRTASLETSRTETCGGGAARLVEVLLPVIVQPLGSDHDGELSIEGYRRELAKPAPGIPSRGVSVSPMSPAQRAQAFGPIRGVEDRAAESSSVTLEDKEGFEGKRTLSVGLKYKGVDMKLSGELTTSGVYKATVILPGRHRYALRYPNQGYGISWELK